MKDSDLLTVQHPSGEIYYCAKENIHIDNLDNSYNTEIDYISNSLHEISINIDDDLQMTITNIKQTKFYVKSFCLIELTCNILLFYINDYKLFDFIFVIINGLGYISLNKYILKGIISYLIYHYIKTLIYANFSILYIYSYYSIYLQNVLITYYNVSYSYLFNHLVTIILILNTIFQYSITIYIHSYYDLLVTYKNTISDIYNNLNSDLNSN